MRTGWAMLAVAAGLLAGPAAAQKPAARLLAPIAGDARPRAVEPVEHRTTVRPPAADPPDRDSFAFGDKFKDWMGKATESQGLKGDHAFDCLIAPVTSPFLFEDPRASTEVRPLFIYQKVPDAQPNFRGGNLWYAGAQVRVAVTERLSVVLTKLGAASANPTAATPFDTGTSLAELWVGPKYTLWRDEDRGGLLAAGATFQIPAGGEKAFQDTGSLSIAPYASLAHPVAKTRLGTLNGLLNGGYSFSVNKDRSDYLFLNAHLDWDVGDRQRFYPLVELSYTRTTTDGRERPFIAGEGRDLINFGGTGKGGLLSGAVGGRVKLTKSLDLGAAFELPLAGDKDFFGHRFTVDLIWRY